MSVRSQIILACGVSVRNQSKENSNAKHSVENVPGIWPWTVAIYSNGVFRCGGTLVSDKMLITAGYCSKG